MYLSPLTSYVSPSIIYGAKVILPDGRLAHHRDGGELALPVGRIEPVPHPFDFLRAEAQRGDPVGRVAGQQPVQDGVGLGLADSELGFGGLATITSGTPRWRARALTWVLNRSPMGLTGGVSSACQVK